MCAASLRVQSAGRPSTKRVFDASGGRCSSGHLVGGAHHAALIAKYTDPLVYTGPIRVRTGSEILRITSYLQRDLNKITVPFSVLHGTADRVTDPCASQALYDEATSQYKAIKLYEGFLHDLLFEPEQDDIVYDIINWMEIKLKTSPPMKRRV